MNEDSTCVIDDWLYQVEQTRADSTHNLYKSVIEQLYDYGGDPGTWTAQTIAGFLDRCAERGNQASTRRTKLGVIRAFLSDMNIDLPTPESIPVTQSSPVTATEEEMDLLIRHADGKYRLALLLMADAGLTESEVRKLRWRDVSGDSLFVYGPASKTRTVPIITRRLAQAGEANGAGGDEFVVPGRRGKMLARGYLNYVLRGACARAGMERRLTARSVRHGFVARAVRRGVPAKAIQQAVGHSNLATTDRYLAELEGDADFVRRSFEPLWEREAPDVSQNLLEQQGRRMGAGEGRLAG